MSYPRPIVTARDVKVGQGAEIEVGKTIKVNYTMALNNWEEDGGRVVDSTTSKGRPFR